MSLVALIRRNKSKLLPSVQIISVILQEFSVNVKSIKLKSFFQIKFKLHCFWKAKGILCNFRESLKCLKSSFKHLRRIIFYALKNFGWHIKILNQICKNLVPSKTLPNQTQSDCKEGYQCSLIQGKDHSIV